MHRLVSCLFQLRQLGFHQVNQIEEWLVVWIAVLSWFFKLHVLAVFIEYLELSSFTVFVGLSGLTVFFDLEVLLWRSCSKNVHYKVFILALLVQKINLLFIKVSFITYSVFRRSGILPRLRFFIFAITFESS